MRVEPDGTLIQLEIPAPPPPPQISADVLVTASENQVHEFMKEIHDAVKKTSNKLVAVS